jgi:glycerol kinase
MEKKYILALDQGTTSSRSILFDRSGNPAAAAQEEFRQIYPKAGWVEHDPLDIWNTQIATARRVLAESGIKAEEIAAIGITNQRETTLVWDRKTGEPVYNAIVWQCRRTTEICEMLREEGYEDDFRARTGLVIDAYFSGTKVKWILDAVDGARDRAERGELCFGTVDAWLLYNLTGEHATDYTNASRTLLFNIHDLAWDGELLKRLDVPRALLPEVKPTSHVFGTTAALGAEIPVAAMAGDQQSALFGQAAFSDRESKNTYGTGCFLLMNTGETPVASENGLLTTIAWGLGGRVQYALEGSVFTGGAVIQWLRDELRLIASAAESEAAAAEAEDTNGVYVVPAFTGLGAPHWDMRARGIIYGLTRGANRAHLIRAALESISFQSADVLRAMEYDAGSRIPGLRVDGGASANNLLMQHQADVLNIPVIRGRNIESTALGAAFLAGLATGFWRDLDEISDIWQVDREFTPSWDENRRNQELAGWEQAINHAKTDKSR